MFCCADFLQLHNFTKAAPKRPSNHRSFESHLAFRNRSHLFNAKLLVRTVDADPLQGDVHRGKDARRTIRKVNHGNLCNRSQKLNHLRSLQSLNLSLLARHGRTKVSRVGRPLIDGFRAQSFRTAALQSAHGHRILAILSIGIHNPIHLLITHRRNRGIRLQS